MPSLITCRSALFLGAVCVSLYLKCSLLTWWEKMASERGRVVPMTLPRRWIGDMLHFAQKVPIVAGERTLRVRAMAEARRAVPDPPTWQSLITKGIALAALQVPDLLRAYIPYPWPRLYEAPYSVASMIFDRVYEGEHATFMAPMLYPERLALHRIEEKVRAWKTEPIEAHGVLRRLVRNAKPPRPIRRLLWSVGLNWNGYFRARTFGTFAVNTVAGLRSRMLQFQTPITSVWYYGNVSRTGEMEIQSGFDHRVFDGYAVTKAVSILEGLLNNELLEEVRNPPKVGMNPLQSPTAT